MTYRTTNIQQTKNFIDQLYNQRSEMDRVRNQVASGLKIIKPSDDPGRVGTITKFQNTIQRLEKHSERISVATNILETQSSILDSVQNILLRAREIASQASNGTIPKDTRAAMAKEVFQLRDALIGLINTRNEGSYIYGGADDDDPPFDIADPITGGYNPPGDGTSPESIRYIFDNEVGTSTTKEVQVTDSDKVKISTSANIFENAVAAVERLGRALSGYSTTPAAPALPDGGGVAYTFPDDYQQQSEDIVECLDLLESAQSDDIELERTSLGGRINRLSQAKDVLDLVKLNTDKARSEIQDVDIFSAASKLSSMEVSLEALLASGAKINDLSILDFL